MWDHGQPRSLALPPGAVSGGALDINDRGEIVGQYQLNVVWSEQRSFIWRDGIVTDLLPLDPGGNSVALGINNRGQVVGQAVGTVDGRTVSGAYLWTTSTTRVAASGMVSGDLFDSRSRGVYAKTISKSGLVGQEHVSSSRATGLPSGSCRQDVSPVRKERTRKIRDAF